MRKYRVALLAFISIFVFASCDEDLLDDLLDIEESFSFTIELPVIAEDSEFNASEVFNLSVEVGLINDYGDLIKSVSLDQVFFQILEYEGNLDIDVDAGVLYVMEPDGSNQKMIASLGEVNLMELVENPMELELNAEGVSLLGELAKNPPHSLMLHYVIEFDESNLPVIFLAEFEFFATMVASPLK